MRGVLLLAVVIGLSACGSESSTAGTRLPETGDVRFGTVNEDQLRRMVEIDPADDGPFHMINLIKFREKADYQDGRETDLTGREADALYAPLEFLEEIGAKIVFVADVETNTLGDDGSGGGGLLEVTDNGTGTLCATDAACEGQEADKCLSFEDAGFCTVEGCGAGTCEGPYLCCHDCADFAAALLPFEGSACFPSSETAQLTGAAQCTCD